MADGRENANIWFCLKGLIFGPRLPFWAQPIADFYPKTWWLKQTLGVCRSPYFWHDSFGKYWNRLVTCRVRGHRDVHDVADHSCDCAGEPPRMWCFKCERDVTGQFWDDALRMLEDKF